MRLGAARRDLEPNDGTLAPFVLAAAKLAHDTRFFVVARDPASLLLRDLAQRLDAWRQRAV